MNDNKIIAHDGTVLFEPVDKNKIRCVVTNNLNNSHYSKVVHVYYNDKVVGQISASIFGVINNNRELSESAVNVLKGYYSVLLGLSPHIYSQDTISNSRDYTYLRLYHYNQKNEKVSDNAIVNIIAKSNYDPNKAVLKNLEKVIQEFWDYTKDNYHTITNKPSNLDELLRLMLTFNQANASLYGIISLASHKNSIEMSRFLPAFLEQNEHDTLSDFMDNTSLGVVNTGKDMADKAFRFIANNKRISSPRIYEILKAAPKENLLSLIKSHYVIKGSISIDAAIFDLKERLNPSNSMYANESEMFIEFSQSFVKAHEVVSQNYDSKVFERLFNYQKSCLSVFRFSADKEYHKNIPARIKGVLWLGHILKETQVSSEELGALVSFIDNTEQWAEGDKEKSILALMIEKISPEDIVDIAYDIYTSNVKATTANWIKYIDNFEDRKGINISLGLEMDSNRRTKSNY